MLRIIASLAPRFRVQCPFRYKASASAEKQFCERVALLLEPDAQLAAQHVQSDRRMDQPAQCTRDARRGRARAAGQRLAFHAALKGALPKRMPIHYLHKVDVDPLWKIRMMADGRAQAMDPLAWRVGDVVQVNDELLESPSRPMSGYYHPDLAEKLPEQTLLIEKIVEKRK